MRTYPRHPFLNPPESGPARRPKFGRGAWLDSIWGRAVDVVGPDTALRIISVQGSKVGADLATGLHAISRWERGHWAVQLGPANSRAIACFYAHVC